MNSLLPIFLFLLLSFLGLDTRAYVQDTIIKYTNTAAPEYKVDFVISGDNPNTSFKPNPSTAEQASSSNTSAGGVISFPNGKKVAVAETPTSIEDKEGKIYAVGEDGKVTKAAEKTKATESLAGNMSTREKTTTEGTVSFSAYKGQIYAFDEYNPQYTNASDYAKKYEEFGGEKVSVKSIARGKPDRVSIAFDGGMPIDSIYFLTPAGVRYKAEKDEQGGYFLNLIGGESNDAQEVYAILPNRQDTTKPYSIGKLIVAAYPRQEKTLTLVAVNGAKVDTAGVVKKINEIYNPLNIYWKINIAENFENKTWDTDKDDALNVMGSKWYSTYTEEMKALKNAYTQQNNIDPRMLYMFVLNKAKTDNETNAKTILGDMPRGKQFGFLFTEKSDPATLAKTIAHELGHGYFQLKHPFEMGLSQQERQEALMSYGDGIAFNKYEWDLMHDPGIVMGLFESDTSGQFAWLPWIDAVIDIGFVLYDAGVLIYEKATTGETSPENWIALSADGASILVPMSVGAGQVAKAAYKAATSAEKVNDVRKVVTKVDESTKAIKIYKHNYKYSDRVRMRGTQDPMSHNFPYSFDDVILSAKPIPKENGYRIFQQQGTMGGKQGVFEIGVNKEGIIDHRFFRPHKTTK